jgi:putative acetyltransferase
MSPTLRAYRASDRAACRHVFHRAVREGAADAYTAAQLVAWSPTDAFDPSEPDDLLQQVCLVAEQDGRIAGFMSLWPDGYLDMAFVLPEARGTGVADALYAALLDHARAEGINRLTVHASHLARRFFLKRGWQVDAAEDYPLRGQTLERFAMSLPLKVPTP